MPRIPSRWFARAFGAITASLARLSAPLSASPSAPLSGSPSAPLSSPFSARQIAAVALIVGVCLPHLLPAAAAAEDCSGAPPWINEIDYDSDDGGLNDDRDEFVELAAPVGSDLGGYELASVEGNSNLFSFCLTDAPGVTTGNAHFSVVLPPGTIADKHNGNGVGFVVVCFTDTSANVEAAGDCDVVLPGDSSESNLRNGDLQNLDPVLCPDGLVLADAGLTYVDALSWEGLVPGLGTWGPLFGLIDIGIDAGDLAGVSLQKTSSAASQTFVSSEWAVSGSAASASPGAENPGQAITCDPICGNGFGELDEECDDGNSQSEDGCSDLCLAEFCGDGTPQPGLGEACDDGNTQSEDGCSDLCIVEFCGDGIVQPGLAETCDDGNDNEYDACLSTCEPNELPTLDGWGLLGLVLLLTTAGSAALRRNRRLEASPRRSS